MILFRPACAGAQESLEALPNLAQQVRLSRQESDAISSTASSEVRSGRPAVLRDGVLQVLSRNIARRPLGGLHEAVAADWRSCARRISPSICLRPRSVCSIVNTAQLSGGRAGMCADPAWRTWTWASSALSRPTIQAL